jgi:hypothetical protein
MRAVHKSGKSQYILIACSQSFFGMEERRPVFAVAQARALVGDGHEARVID